MYHYIRDIDKKYPYLNILNKKIFLSQIKKFLKLGIIKSYDEIFVNNSKFLLTFDDGLKDHLYAAEILKKNNCIGVFFIPTDPIKNNNILDVHKTHLIIGKFKGKDVMNELDKYLKKKKLKNFFNNYEEEKYLDAYQKHNDEFFKLKFKKIMNYYGNIELKKKALNYLLKIFDVDMKAEDYYLNEKEIKYLSSINMVIGSHTVNHTLLSRLNYKKQFDELEKSKLFLEKLIKREVSTFCYPYGGTSSYNNTTHKILKKLKYKLAFSVKDKSITLNDIKNNPFELPRFDCKCF